MSEIASEMRVTEAALYRYVESKEGLFQLVISHLLLLRELPDEELPLPSPPLDVTLKEIQASVSGARPFVEPLAVALRRRRVEDVRVELEAIVREFFFLTGLTRRATDIIERSAREMPEFAALMSSELRHPLLTSLTDYLEKRTRSGHLRPTPDPAVTARFIIETVTWFARHRFNHPNAADISDEAAEATVVDLVTAALVPCADEE